MAEITPEEIDRWRGAEGDADLTGNGIDRDGNLTLTFTVHPKSKYDLMPITDVKGRAFKLKVTTNAARVFAGRKGLDDARERAKAVIEDE